jgi:predicted transcriptional regulator of viral defense system
MRFERLLQVAGDEPLFTSGLLLAGDVNERDVRRQLSRWTAAGRIVELRRGLYALSRPYAKVRAHPFLVANMLVPGSYVSLQSALAHHGLIPEYVPAVTSVGAARPGRWETPLGAFELRHVRPALLFGYSREEVLPGQHAFVARPEKALLDLVHLTPGGHETAFLDGLRLQNLSKLDLPDLRRLAAVAGMPKWKRAAAAVAALSRNEEREYEDA